MVKKRRRIGESMYGEKIDLDALNERSGWSALGEEVQIISKDEKKVLATVNINTLILCWVEKENEAYNEMRIEKKAKQAKCRENALKKIERKKK